MFPYKLITNRCVFYVDMKFYILSIMTLSACMRCQADDGLKPGVDLKTYYEEEPTSLSLNYNFVYVYLLVRSQSSKSIQNKSKTLSWKRILVNDEPWSNIILLGDTCDAEGQIGNCTKVQECEQAILDIKQKKRPKSCGFQGADPLVCCLQERSETDSRNKEDDCKFKYGLKCEEVQRKSHDACVKYQEARCPSSKIRVSEPAISPADTTEEGVPEVSAGEDAVIGQFPYMALLGYGKNASAAEWQCGGSIISHNFILTAGHCIGDVKIGPVSFAVVGSLRRSDPIQDGRLFKIKRVFKHPDYHPPHKYNDIALLELETNITFNDVIQPACLYSDKRDTDTSIVVGWGTVGYLREIADVLQYAEISKFPDEECSRLYHPGRLLKQGLNFTTQLCYGHHTRPKDTCQGDSGGPLVATYSMFPCLPTVAGVTSFGKQCGQTGVPGVYTRVASYLSWIESVVWS